MKSFTEWIKECVMKKCNCKEKICKGVRDAKKDLSADYKGHIAQNGTVEPFKLVK